MLLALENTDDSSMLLILPALSSEAERGTRERRA
jgi:hypothetical protein